MSGRSDRSSVIAGGVFVLLGALFLIEQLGILAVSVALIWPILLIGLGIALLAGGSRRKDQKSG